MYATTEDTDVGKICPGAKNLFVGRHGSTSPRKDSILEPEELVEREGPGSHGETGTEEHSRDGYINCEHTLFDEAILLMGFRADGNELVIKFVFEQIPNELTLV